MPIPLHYRLPVLLLGLVGLVASGCQSNEQTPAPTRFERMPPSETGVTFANDVTEDRALNVITFEYMYNGAGVGAGDLNNDGRPDLVFVANMGASRVYLNEGDLQFRDVTASSGIDTEGKWVNGVSMVDVNHDGHLDLYFSVGGPYTDPERRANELYINNGDSTFTERAAAYGLADTGHTTQAAFLDYDRDGDLDAYLLTSGFEGNGANVVDAKKTEGQSITTDRLYENNGDGTFTDVSAEAGIQIEGHGLGVAVVDVNRDGWPDIYAANDYVSNDLLYVNDGDGTFTERAGEIFRHQSYAAMGTDVADVNNDGRRDVVTLDMLPPSNDRLKQMYETVGPRRYRQEMQQGYAPQVKRNTLQLHAGRTPQGDPTFQEIGALAGIHTTDWSWSPLLADFDHDGWRDLFVTNGLPRDITQRSFANRKLQVLRQESGQQAVQTLFEASRDLSGAHVHNYLFQNDGDRTFTNRSAAWGMDRPSYSMGATYADLDGDGDLDLVTNNLNAPASIYRNTTADTDSTHWLKVSLDGPEQTPRGRGARVSMYANGQQQTARQAVVRGYKSSVPATQHFGLDTTATVDSVVVVWPDVRRTVRRTVAADQTIEIRYDAAGNDGYTWPAERPPEPTLFTDVTDERILSVRHAEAYYSDYKIQPLLPHKFSQLGPGIAVGDVNGDGREDAFVGGAFRQSGQLLLQQADGSFRRSTLESGNNYEEDTGTLFFDANGDGHLDLYVASGGSEFEPGSRYYQDRLYLGDGTGSFEHAPDRLPELRTSSSVVTAADFDRDGDLDLFVGSRLKPNQYPVAPRSHLLENRDGTFADVTQSVAPALQSPGLVTDALWTDVNADDWRDLIVVGEWMPITVLVNEEGRLSPATDALGLADTVGWWNSIASGDFDRDGDTDYVVGNLGRNTLLKNTEAGPVRIHYGDFNGDGRMDPVLSRYIQGTSVPVAFRNDLVRQLPNLKATFSSYDRYAQTTIETLFAETSLSDPTVKASDTFRSSYLENTDDGFRVRPLPIAAQAGPVYGMTTGYYDGDAHRDLLLIGNSYAPEPFTGRYDALHGLLLRGDGAGHFVPVPMPQSGFFVEGDGTALAHLTGADGTRLVLAARNDDTTNAVRVNRTRDWPRVATRATDVSAHLTFEDGTVERVELHHGSGYLSQSSRTLVVPPSVSTVRITNRQGATRKIEI
jgi:hypothetical protein